MKKIIALVLALVFALSFAACGKSANKDINAKSEGTMTYAEYDAAELNAKVVVEAYVQAHQSWYNDKITVYAQDGDGGYFFYNMACSESDAQKLVPGTKIKVTGYKAEFSGEIEVADATFEFVDGPSYIAKALDVTDLLGTDGLNARKNMFVSFKGLTVEGITYKNGEPGDDIYVAVSKDGKNYNFCVEYYLTGSDTQVYKDVCALTQGQTIDVECFLYYYEGINPHITSVTVK